MKKLLSMVLALMLCLSLMPATAEYGVIGGADGPTEVFVSSAMQTITLPDELGEKALAAGRRGEVELRITELTGLELDDEALEAAIGELMDSIIFRAAEQGDEASYVVSIGQTDVLTFDLANTADEYFVRSNLLGSPIAFKADEVSGILSRLLDTMVQYGMLDESTAVALEQSLASLGQESTATAFNMEDLLTMDYSALTSALSTLNGQIEIVADPTVPGNCDPAVVGEKISVTNEQMVQICKAYIQLLRDNPELMSLVAQMTGTMTEEQAAAMAEMYAVDISSFQSMTLESVLAQVEAELDSTPILDGTFDVYACMDENGVPVYFTVTMPIYTASASLEGEETTASVEVEADASTEIVASPSADMIAELEADGTTTVLSLEYYRQTVAEGVSHVVNLFADEESITIDALVKDNTAHIVFTAPDAEPVVLDLTWTDSTVSAILTVTDVTIAFDGAYVYTDAAYKLDGTLTFTNASDFAGERIAVDFHSDYALNGVDFDGTFKTSITIEDLFDTDSKLAIAMEGTARTTDPIESVVTADALRPADMDDATFTQWFATVLNALNGWTGTLLMSLPESLLNIILSSGM